VLNAARTLLFPSVVVVVTTLLGLWVEIRAHAQQTRPDAVALSGAWTLNKDLSDEASGDDRQQGGDQSGRHGGYGRGGGMGGFGHGGGRRGAGYGGGGGGSTMDPDAAQRMRDAMHDYLVAPERLTIVQTDSMILVTTGEGRVTRMSPDGKKIKDDNTKIERKTKWDAGKLVSEVSGIGRGKITESYAVDPEQHRLTVTIVMENSSKPRTITRVYDSSTSSSSMPATTSRTFVSARPIASSARSSIPLKWI
jgi:hypothetical protein